MAIDTDRDLPRDGFARREDSRLGSGTITRQCKQLDTALDLAPSKRKVPTTRAGR